MMGPPQLWTVIVTQWCPLPAALAWVWWRAISKAQWSLAVEWRDAFLEKAQQQAVLTRGEVAGFLGHLVTLPTLMQLVGALRHERVLLAQDARQLEDRLLALADRDGQWKHRTQTPCGKLP
jgi:hypothetical protein